MATPTATTVWRCPLCRGALEPGPNGWACAACARSFPIVAGIPDFRLDTLSWIDVAQDLRRATELVERVPPDDIEASVDFVFRRRVHWDAKQIARRVREVVEAPIRLSAQLDEWLAPLATRDTVLDVGCGPGALLAALASRGREAIGVDVSLEWAVVAERAVAAAGGTPCVACGLAEALPLADASVGSVAVLDVIEHVGDPQALVAEVGRVVKPGGAVALATPNRFSLAAEPHVGVWGVGWLPARHQDRYVQWRSGKPYGFVRLLSRRELARILDSSSIAGRVRPATVPDHDLSAFPARRAAAAKAYNALVKNPLAARLVAPISPFFHVVGNRRLQEQPLRDLP
jgi:SAM-dependent methyltransferase